MGFKCCVPRCRGNYDKQNKVSVFKFPNDEVEKQKWLRAIKRDDYVPTKNSVVCELHFNPDDILRFSVYPCESGEVITVHLLHPRLSAGAVPTILPNCPPYLSKTNNAREGPEEKKRKRENEQLVQALEESVHEFEVQTALRSFSNLSELKEKLDMMDLSEFWDMVIRAL